MTIDALVTLVTVGSDDKIHTAGVGRFASLDAAFAAAKKACGAPRAKGSKSGDREMRFTGPLGTAHVGY